MTIEVAIPCYNEEPTIGKVVGDFRIALPDADVVVYDNNSKDASARVAQEAGARVVRVNRQGKGYVVQQVFENTQADIVVMVDGDDTYEADDVGKLIEPLKAGDADMTIGTRLHCGSGEFRQLHHFGNRLMTRALNFMFGQTHKDILSGYRGFSRRFIENVPVVSVGFEVETELMIQAMETGMIVKEIPTGFRQRPPGSDSKLSTARDGYRILVTMVKMLRDHRPLMVFSVLGLVSAAVGGTLWLAVILQGAEGRLPSALRSLGAVLVIGSVALFWVGLVLNTVNTRMRELSLLMRRKGQ
ncbi:glycosyltransferase family 2 protein [Verrucomicrobiota bacterium]